VRHLLGDLRPASAVSLMAAAAVLLALVGATLYLLRPVPAEWCLPLSPLALLALIVACVPAGMTSRQAERLLS
jgi:uncharacterized membrane protein (UPF0136 family)